MTHARPTRPGRPRAIPTDIQRAREQRPFPLDRLVFHDRVANRIRLIARAWITIAVTGFFLATLRVDIPRNPDIADWDIYVEIGLLILTLIGALISWRWEATGASLIVAGGIGAGALAAIELGPLRALLVTVALLVPGVMFWLVWQRTRPLWHLATLAAVLIVALAVAGIYATDAYRTTFGPLQPESTVGVAPAERVVWAWSGGVTDSSLTVTAAVENPEAPPRLLLSMREDFANPRIIEPEQPSRVSPGVWTFVAHDLTPDTDYWYAVNVDGLTDTARHGHVRTYPRGAASFTFAFASCAHTGSNATVFDTIRDEEPLFFLSLGDFFYENIDLNDPRLYREAFDDVLASPAQGTLYRSAPIAYVWDDHDYGPNDADGTSPGKDAAQRNYRDVVPHYPLPAGEEIGPIYQAFTVGRVRFIVTDASSEKSPEAMPDGPEKTMLGAAQKAWLKDELLAANGTYPVIVWVNSQPWISKSGDGAIGWGAYATEREEIATFIADHDIRGLMMLSGDAHMLAIDDGSNSNYATTGDASFPVFHAAALDRPGAEKGGPYSHGAYPGAGQFGLVTIEDDGGTSITVTWSGRNFDDEEIVGYRFTVDARRGIVPSGEGVLPDRRSFVALL
jgi:phosphodiesterase/alkaline phosphatase D-like protein